MSRPANEETHRRVKALASAGLSQRALARELGWSRGRVRHYLESQLGVSTPLSTELAPPDVCSAVRQAYGLGLDEQAIAARFELPLATVQTIRRRAPGTHGSDSGQGDAPTRRKPRWPVVGAALGRPRVEPAPAFTGFRRLPRATQEGS